MSFAVFLRVCGVFVVFCGVSLAVRAVVPQSRVPSAPSSAYFRSTLFAHLNVSSAASIPEREFFGLVEEGALRRKRRVRERMPREGPPQSGEWYFGPWDVSFPRSVLPCGWRGVPDGHLEPLGCQRDSDGVVEAYDEAVEISPLEFHTKHVVGRKPVVFRGAAKRWSAFGTWNDMVLRERYGDLNFLVEVKFEDRETEPKTMRLREFLDVYERQRGYIVSVLPEPMAEEVEALGCVVCGSYRETLQETNFWLSSGDTVSALHKDADHIVNCVLQGTKRWILIDPVHGPKVALNSSSDPSLAAMLQRSDFSDINPSAVDIHAFPYLPHTPFSHATLHQGDCIFLPSGWLHQVRSPPGRNLAVAMMFMSLHNQTQFKQNQSCIKQNAHPFSSLPFPWKYSGRGRVPLGYVAPEEIRGELLGMVERAEGGVLGLKEFLHMFVADGGGSWGTARRVFEILTELHTKHPTLSAKDVKALSTQKLKLIALAIDAAAGVERDLVFREHQEEGGGGGGGGAR